MMRWGNYGWGMSFGWLFMVIFWALAIFGIVYVVQAISRKPESPGEITKEEFERMNDDHIKF